MDNNLKKYDVIVLGGGAAGMMAAITASGHGAKTLLIEKNKRLGEKLRITGGGRCNILNAEKNLKVLLRNYGTAEQYLYSAFSKFGVEDTIEFFDKINVPIKVEAKNRAFPKSDKAYDVVHSMINILDKNEVEVLNKTTVSGLRFKNDSIESVVCGDVEYTASQYIISTGGVSRPETGSSGDGFGWLEKLGHILRTPSPNITPLSIFEKNIVKSVAGVSVKSVKVSFYLDGQKQFSLDGDVLFTHFGLSGPLIMNSAYKVSELLQAGVVNAKIDCFPGVEIKDLDLKLVQILNTNGTKLLKNILPLFLPPGLAPLIKEKLKTDVNFEVKCSEAGRDTRKIIVNKIKNIDLTVESLMGFEKAVVADGGISLKEVDMRTMKSLKADNLYIVGDLLDINRPSGGFSLQLCWTTGYVAGLSAANLSAGMSK